MQLAFNIIQAKLNYPQKQANEIKQKYQFLNSISANLLKNLNHYLDYHPVLCFNYQLVLYFKYQLVLYFSDLYFDYFPFLYFDCYPILCFGYSYFNYWDLKLLPLLTGHVCSLLGNCLCVWMFKGCPNLGFSHRPTHSIPPHCPSHPSPL